MKAMETAMGKRMRNRVSNVAGPSALPGPPKLSLLCGLAGIALACAVPPDASVLGTPLSNSGTCPEFTRTAMPMPPRFLNNPNDITQKKFPNTMQVDVPPERSVNCAQVPSDFKVELWASEKDVGNIKALQAFAFDERGRLWAVETFDYPNTITDPFSGHDRVVILEDTDGDHIMDKHTVFVSGISMAQGIEIVPGGVLVAMAPHIVLFEDKNGDDKADSPTGTILYTGFSKNDPGDTHGGVGNLRYGLDNWLWGDNGYNPGGKVKGVSVFSGPWRGRLDGSKFEFMSKLGNNSSGMGFMEDGQVFASTANNDHTTHMVIPGDNANSISAYGQSYNPITKDVNQGDWFGNFTAASNHEIYTARLFPKAYWDRAAFVCEGTGHLINMDFLKPKGSTWEATRIDATPNLFASTDAWTAPIMAKVGPDGAVWVLDWHNYLFLHNGELPEGAGHAYNSDLRVKTACRIYRIVPKDGKVDPVLNLSNATLPQLVETFRNTNMFWRLTAQKMIMRKAAAADAKAQLEPLLLNALKSRARDDVGNDPYALHSLWAAEGLGLFSANAAGAAGTAKWDSALKVLLLHPAAAVRMNVLKAMPRTTASSQAIKDQGRVNDPDPQVRIQALLALSQIANKATGITMFADYRNLDALSKTAYDKAGIAESAILPAIPDLQPVVGLREDAREAARETLIGLKAGLRFGVDREGNWAPMNDGRLSAGDLLVYDLKGKNAATLRYDGRSWSATPKGLRDPVYLYVFRSRSGVEYRGRILTETR
jgi:putative membrane-bound dehydrogenase-like protein